MIQLSRADEIERALASGAYDFIDFGSSKGGSMTFAVDKLGATRGLGIDINAAKVEETRALGFDALRYDLTQLGAFPDVVSFCILAHFLEHLPGYPAAKQCINSAIAAARDYVLIRQPWFDADTELFHLGLKAYWSDWHGHTHHMRVYDLYRAAARNERVREIRLLGRRRIADSSDPTILPLSSGEDRHRYDPSLDGPKPPLDFSFPMFQEVVCIISLRDGIDIDDISSRLGQCEPLRAVACLRDTAG